MASRAVRAVALAALAAATLAGCQVGYYTQLIRGQVDLLSRREPIERLIARPDTDAALKQRLSRALEARSFASQALHLPDNGSYRQYADLQRPYAVWNVFAAPELSLKGKDWCYLFTGCLEYRGFFSEQAARREAEALAHDGYDVYVAGVPAYSTLGWFDDPLLNTLGTREDVVAGTIFHELAHQVCFVAGDTAFNESFATFVEEEGLRRYLAGRPALAQAVRERDARREQFIALMLSAREHLQAIYEGGAMAAEKRQEKAQAFARLREDYAALKREWGGDASYDGWMAGELNNARLLPFGLYHQWVGAFGALFAQSGGDWTAFYASVRRVADLAPEERRMLLLALAREPVSP